MRFRLLRVPAWLGLVASLSIAACSGEDVVTTEADATAARDAGPRDAAPGDPDGAPSPDAAPAPDGAPPRPDSGLPDAGVTYAGLGALSGACGLVRGEVGKPTPSFLSNTLSFAAGQVFDKAFLSDGGDIIFDNPNAGGSSKESEVMSFELLHHCDGAKLLKTETQIVYGPPPDGGQASITDLLVEIDGKKVGVNPLRVYKPSNQPQPTEAEIKTSLERKLENIKASTARVTPADKWVKQVMHVMTATQANADAVARIVPTIAADTRADTIILLTRSVGGGFLYCGVTRAPLGQECP